jgi:hypothetical protein
MPLPLLPPQLLKINVVKIPPIYQPSPTSQSHYAVVRRYCVQQQQPLFKRKQLLLTYSSNSSGAARSNCNYYSFKRTPAEQECNCKRNLTQKKICRSRCTAALTLHRRTTAWSGHISISYSIQQNNW